VTVSAPRFGSTAFVSIAVALAALVAGSVTFAAQTKREFVVSAHRYAYEIAGTDDVEIRVQQDDLVQVTFSADDIAHSFTLDEYRINKRAEPGKPVTFSFRADKPGTYAIYCSLAIDERCRKETVASLVVTPRARH
jgi:heme/copper-type cytochrome/quinol oxidase subunit 2